MGSFPDTNGRRYRSENDKGVGPYGKGTDINGCKMSSKLRIKLMVVEILEEKNYGCRF